MPRIRNSASAVNVVTTAETILVSTPGIAIPAAFPVDIIADLDFSTGTGVTGVTINVRRGPLVTSPLVGGVGPIAIAASTRGKFTFAITDTQAGEQAGLQYTVTIVQAAATGNGTGNLCYVRADWG